MDEFGLFLFFFSHFRSAVAVISIFDSKFFARLDDTLLYKHHCTKSIVANIIKSFVRWQPHQRVYVLCVYILPGYPVNAANYYDYY